jgi:hypothetical protein
MTETLRVEMATTPAPCSMAPVYVRHCFQNKTLKTGKADIDLAAKR